MTPPPNATGGGLLNAIVGSLILTALGIAVGAPVGLLAGTFMAEYGRYSKLTSVIRFINDILLSAPSIIIGLFVYGAIVVPMGGFSGLAGAIALAVIALPVVVRTTEDMLLLVPQQLREAAAALGLPRSFTIATTVDAAALSLRWQDETAFDVFSDGGGQNYEAPVLALQGSALGRYIALQRPVADGDDRHIAVFAHARRRR